MIGKQACLNNAAFSFTGREASPLGLGWCASAESPGTLMRGRDKRLWVVGMKNNVQVWLVVSDQEAAAATVAMEKDRPVIETRSDDGEEAQGRADDVDKEGERVAKKVVRMKGGSTADTASSANPARKPTSFNIFMKHQMQVLKAENIEPDHRKRFGLVASKWKALSASEKEDAVAEALRVMSVS